MASTAAQNIDTWIRAPYTTADYLSTGIQQHPGNGVVEDAANTVIRFSVAKTPHSYDPAGLAAVCGSKVYSVTPQMRSAYAGYDMDVDRLAPNTGTCA